MLKRKTLVKSFVLICVFMCCMYVNTVQAQVVVLCPLLVMNHLIRKRFFLF
jgi:hypothetical protein